MNSSSGTLLENGKELFAVLALLLALHAVFYPGVFLRGESIGPADLIYHYRPWSETNPLQIRPGAYTLSDQFDAIIPTIAYQMDRLGHGEIPAYSDKIQNGTPLFWVIRHEAKLIPIIALSRVFSFPVAWTVFLIGRMIAGGLFLYALLRRYGFSKGSGALASVTFCFSSYVIQNFGITMAGQYAMIPMLFYGVERVLSGTRGWLNTGIWFSFLSLLVSQLIFTGYPTTVAYIALLTAAFTVWRAFTFRIFPTGNFVIVGLLAVVGLALSAPGLLASRDFFSEFDWGYRTNYWASAVLQRMWITYFFPFYFGPAYADRWIREAVYVGLVPLVFAAYGLVASLRRERDLTTRFARFNAFAALLVIVCAYNVAGAVQIVRYIPVINASMPNNLIILIPVFLSVLTAYGVSIIQRRETSLSTLIGFAALFGIALFAVQRVLAGQNELWADVFRSDHVQQQAQLFAAAIIIFGAFAIRPLRKIALVAVLCVTALDLYLHGAGWNRTLANSAYFSKTPGIEFLQNNLGESKMFLLEREFLANTPEYFGLRTIAGRGFFNVRTKQVYDVLSPNVFKDVPTQAIFPADQRTRLDLPLFDAMAIRYVIAPKGIDPNTLGQPSEVKFRLVYDHDLSIWENTKAFSRGWFVSRAEVLEDGQLIAGLRDGSLNLRATAYLSPEAGAAFPQPREFFACTLGTFSTTDIKQLYQVDCADDGFFVVSDNYNRGWKAFVDNRPAELWRTNYNFRGIVVPKGAKQIEFRYTPDYLPFGFVFAGIGGAMLLCLVTAVQRQT